MLDSKFCHSCGRKIAESTSLCEHCGAKQNDLYIVRNTNEHLNDEKFSTTSLSYVVEEKSLLATILLAYFLGAFGGQNFYLGRTLRGILSVVFMATGIPAIISYIEMIGFTRSTIDILNTKYNVRFIDCEKIVKTIFFVIALIALATIPLMVVLFIISYRLA